MHYYYTQSFIEFVSGDDTNQTMDDEDAFNDFGLNGIYNHVAIHTWELTLVNQNEVYGTTV